MEILFWSCVLLTAYTYAGYPCLMAVLAMVRPAPVATQPTPTPYAPSISIVLVAHNEVSRIAARVSELLGLLKSSGFTGELIVVSDGSTDGTAQAARVSEEQELHVMDLAENLGKAAALTAGCAAARGEVLVLADARQSWTALTIPELVAPLADPSVGAVSGELILRDEQGLMAGVGLYWRYEKWLRTNEGRVHSTIGVSGSVSAVRRELFTPIPAGTVLDDVYWPMHVIRQRRRVVHNPLAIANDRLPPSGRGEFRRKTRTLSGNLQLVALATWLLVPGMNPVWLQFMSHKLLRLVVPWALIAALLASAVLEGALYRWLLAVQIAGYATGTIGLLWPAAARSRLLGAAGSFVLLNAASFVAFWVWLSGGSSRSWTKVAYAPDKVRK
jgi:cellulose synthase/poly-beta-1,6-N-acetylglucosamine synthase-like glycosyltransferase